MLWDSFVEKWPRVLSAYVALALFLPPPIRCECQQLRIPPDSPLACSHLFKTCQLAQCKQRQCYWATQWRSSAVSFHKGRRQGVINVKILALRYTVGSILKGQYHIDSCFLLYLLFSHSLISAALQLWHLRVSWISPLCLVNQQREWPTNFADSGSTVLKALWAFRFSLPQSKWIQKAKTSCMMEEAVHVRWTEVLILVNHIWHLLN